ncbi:MAG: type II toxin-antitoxin system VapB family antitoxin [Bryobacterales bacterium]|jgi:antitoxin VapB|nr:type II toxin-antitoxin system VapB family antitoxin [Bryobacterales bacterium]
MPISIKNPESEALIRRLAKLSGESITDAVHHAVAERVQRLESQPRNQALYDELTEIALRCARRPAVSNASEDEILGHDERGISTR